MKKIKPCYIVLFLLLVISCRKNSDTRPAITPNQNFASAQTINDRLGKGVNISAFEADASWQPVFDTSYLHVVADLGFNHVRLPIKWERSDRSLSASPYTINASFFAAIKNVVDAALRNRLHIIINMHHHLALMADPAGQKSRFLSQWKQISTYFKDYPDSLLFEVLNEPNDAITAGVWNDLFSQALNVIRETNPKRCVLIGTSPWGGIAGLDSLVIPKDDHLILTIHYYDPFHFTHQGAEWVNGSDQWLGTKWNDTQFERDEIAYDFLPVTEASKIIPVHIGEYGSYDKGDIDSRIKWTRSLSNWISQQGFSRAYWEFHQGFGFYNPANQQVKTSLVNAILHDPLPPPTPVQLDTIYASDFSSGYDGWFLYANTPNASATSSLNNGTFTIDITVPGDYEWYIQLIRNPFSIHSGKKYHISFTASSSADARNIYALMSMNSEPWTVYSNYDRFYLTTQPRTYGFTFTATTTDNACNIVFSVGHAGTGTVSISNVVFEEVS